MEHMYKFSKASPPRWKRLWRLMLVILLLVPSWQAAKATDYWIVNSRMITSSSLSTDGYIEFSMPVYEWNGSDERVAELGNDDTDNACLLRLQAAGHFIWNIMQLFDSSLNQETVLAPHRSAVEILGNRGKAETGFTREIFHCCCHGGTSCPMRIHYD